MGEFLPWKKVKSKYWTGGIGPAPENKTRKDTCTGDQGVSFLLFDAALLWSYGGVVT